nr:MAG TPA: hypothetical protein [Caudoviricetes sp.]
MPVVKRTDNTININTIENDIDNCIESFLNEMNIDRDYKSLVNIKHSTVNYMFSYIYEHLFKPDHNLPNNQKSLVDYNDVELLQVLADKFINICQRFNKSLGLMSFCYMIGVRYSTVALWLNSDKELNPKRFEVLKNIQESHKAQQIALLNDSPVGSMAVANNDTETGLEWQQKQQQAISQNTVYILPSERIERMKLDKLPE